jgi:hypothetical protein
MVAKYKRHGDPVNNVRFEIIATLRKKKEYLKECLRFSSEVFIKDVNGFKKSYQPGIHMVNDENGGVLADSHSILNEWNMGFTTNVAEHDSFEVEIVILKRYQILA